jgi:putative transposase
VHLIRASLRYVSDADRKALAAAIRPIYTAPNVDAAERALAELADSQLGRRYPGAVAVWERAWDRFTPFLAFPEVRRWAFDKQLRDAVTDFAGDPEAHMGHTVK